MNSETKSLGSQRLTLRGGTIGSHWDPTWKGRGWGGGGGGGGGDWGVIQILSDRDDQCILLGLNIISILEFLGEERFGEYFLCVLN